MATMIDGESYLGKVMIRPLSKTGDVTLYCWPLRCLKAKFGGPTFGVDVQGVEIVRFDPHGSRGHWHKGGYDKLGAGGSHVDFPEGVSESQAQVAWSLEQVREQSAALLAEAGYTDAATGLDADLLQAATADVVAHLDAHNGIMAEAIQKDLVTA